MLQHNKTLDKTLNNPKLQAQLMVTLAVLKANRLVELVAGLISFFALLTITDATLVSDKLLILLVIFAGLAIFYFAIKFGLMFIYLRIGRRERN